MTRVEHDARHLAVDLGSAGSVSVRYDIAPALLTDLERSFLANLIEYVVNFQVEAKK